ncbi:MAG TPA: hypothetical protein VET48_04885 [Steroidobacteraceae bacterium]|nr:hypothetical protein [Steroidobacteraceae bacterium]
MNKIIKWALIAGAVYLAYQAYQSAQAAKAAMIKANTTSKSAIDAQITAAGG